VRIYSSGERGKSVLYFSEGERRGVGPVASKNKKDASVKQPEPDLVPRGGKKRVGVSEPAKRNKIKGGDLKRRKGRKRISGHKMRKRELDNSRRQLGEV